MNQKNWIIGLVILVVILVGAIIYFAVGKKPEPTNNQPTVTNNNTNPTNQTNLKTYTNDKYKFELKYADTYGVQPLASKEAYPELNYEKHLADFLEGVSLISKNLDLSCPNLGLLVYSNEGKTLDKWLTDNSEITQGYANREAATLGGNTALKFWGPAGDLVPNSMYIVSNGSYTFQLNLDFGLRGVAPSSACGDILSGFKFIK